MIEEISCDGTNIPIYIWHREHESMPTNIIFEKDAELNNFFKKDGIHLWKTCLHGRPNY